MHRFARPALAAACAAMAVMATTPTQAQFAKPEDAIKYRQSAMFLMNTHVGRIFAMANGRVRLDSSRATSGKKPS